MKITLRWLKKRDADRYFIAYFRQFFHEETTVKKLVRSLLKKRLYKRLAWIMGQDDYALTERMLELGVDPNTYDTDALKRAAAKGYFKTVKVLCLWGADIRAENDFAFCVAAGHGYLEMVKFLRETDPSINVHVENEYGLREAVRNGYIHMVDYLLKLGCWREDIIDIADKWGRESVKKKLIDHKKA